MAIELNRQNVLQRGFTPPPEEKVAFYVYNQGKYSVERPESDNDSVLGRYAAEPVAWTSELPPSWHATSGIDTGRNAFGPGTPAPVPNPIGSGPSTAKLPSRGLPAFKNSDGLGLHSGSPDHDYAALEREIMDGGGTEIDYPDARPEEVKSDIQEMSEGNRTPIPRPEPLPAVATARSPRRSNVPAGVRDSIFGITHSPGRAARPVQPESPGPATPQTAKLQITIQPPTDPSLSKKSSINQLNGEQSNKTEGQTSSKIQRKSDAAAGPSSSAIPLNDRRRSRANSNAGSDKTASVRGQSAPAPVSSSAQMGRPKSKHTTPRNSMARDEGPPVPAKDTVEPRRSIGGRPSNTRKQTADEWEILDNKEIQEAGKGVSGGSKQQAPKASSVVSAPRAPSALYLQRTQSPSPSSATQRPRAASPLGPAQRVSKVPSEASFREGAASPTRSHRSQSRRQSRELGNFEDDNGALTPRARSPNPPPARKELTEQEALELLRSPRSVFTVSPSDLAAEVHDSNFHDEDLCILLHVADDPSVHDVVRKAVRKAVRSRIKRLGLDSEAQFRSLNAKHMQRQKLTVSNTVAHAITPQWARPLFQMLEEAHSRLDHLDQKLVGSRPGTQNSDYEHHGGHQEMPSVDYEPGEDAMQSPQTETFSDGSPRKHATRRHHVDPEFEEDYEEDGHGDVGHHNHHREEELFRLRMQEPGGKSQATWDVEDESGRPLPEIPGTDGESAERGTSLGLHGGEGAFPHPTGADRQLVMGGTTDMIKSSVPSWQLVHQRLLNWAVVWSLMELDNALESTERGQQVDECALTIWTTQVYKRYVRSRTSDNPPQTIDRLFVPPNVADAVNSAVFNGRHNDAAAMLREMWTPFGFSGMPRLIIVLARHRRDSNHWVVHRIHRPSQPLADNAVAAAAIWRNLIMGSKAERGVDLVRLRDLIHTEIRGLRTRKDLGKLALVAAARNGNIYDEPDN
ncbi:hypothetical protein FRC03_010745 [Tulasnella sp. 419]|nr:hypothetical protein FRC03_010745 [Tulasnella sp. 419]